MNFIGHERIWKLLCALHAREALPHALLLWGAEGTGKQTIARAFAAHMEGRETDDPSHAPLLDAFFLEPDEKGTLGIDAVRQLKAFLTRTPVVSSYRTAIIADADRATDEAQNALLKIAEDPPAHACIMMTVRHPETLLGTLVSRFQKIYVPPVSAELIATWLEDVHGFPHERAVRAAAYACGAPGIAYKVLQEGAYREIYRAAKKFLSLDGAERRVFVKTLLEDNRFDLQKFLDAAILTAYQAPQKNTALLARLVVLREHVALWNVNPRLQLEAL